MVGVLILICTLALIDGSWTLVAVIVTVWGVVGAVYRPSCVIVPAVAVHTTALLLKFVTLVCNVTVSPGNIAPGGLVMVIEPDTDTVTVAVSSLEGSSTLVTVTV